ncbi:MAG: ATP-binding cassette domain-containing protein [Clostridiales Family XIII bacterium]|jgi:ABC-type multidrug transport system ATPase subunit|nr:ATP-binding cassette domain-containing protein [Clostridiales Family XIII bacterium]
MALGDTALELKGIEKRFREPLFSPVSFVLRAGEGLALVGRNGSGKTTLLDIVAGLRRPDAGSVALTGPLGYVMQKDGLSGLLSCRDNLAYEASLRGLPPRRIKARVNEVAELCGVSDFLGERLNRCSAGMRQKVAIAAALLHRPTLLLLDEAFSSLDAQSAERMKAVARGLLDGGGALVMASHSPEDYVGLCQRRLALPEGVEGAVS